MNTLTTQKNAYKTAIARKNPSVPARFVIKKCLPKHGFKSILDWGCGRGRDVEFYREKGLRAEGYDPHYSPDMPKGKFDFVSCAYVLNVIDCPSKRFQCVRDFGDKLKKGGYCLVAIRPHKQVRKSGEKTKWLGTRRWDSRKKAYVDIGDWHIHYDGFITGTGSFQSLMTVNSVVRMLTECDFEVVHTVDNSKVVMVIAKKV